MMGGQALLAFSFTSFKTISIIALFSVEGLSMKSHEQFSLPPPFRLTSMESPSLFLKSTFIIAGVLLPVFFLSKKGSDYNRSP